MKKKFVSVGGMALLVGVVGFSLIPIGASADGPFSPYDDGVYIPQNPPDEKKCIQANVSTLQRENFCRTISFTRPYVRAKCWSYAQNGGTEWKNWCKSVEW